MGSAPTLTRIPCDRVEASPDQNREHFDAGDLAELAASIGELGLLQPIVVRLEADLAGERYVLIGGERRLRACRDILGWADIPAIVRDEAPSESAAFLTLAENMIRVNPGPLEEARGLAAAGAGLEVADLAAKVGKPARWVRDRLALLQLADDVGHYVQSGALPIGRGVLIAGLDVNRQRLALKAHEAGIGPDAFRALVGRLADEQSADAMFDTDTFLRVEEYVVDAEAEVAEVAEPVRIVRERPVGMAEVAELLEVKVGTVAQWRQRGRFPDVELTVGGSPAWWESTVRAWAEATGRG